MCGQTQGNGYYRWDFGCAANTAPTGWNKISETSLANSTTQFTAVDSTGASTGITLQFTTPFTGECASSGPVIQTATPYPINVTKDYLYVNGTATGNGNAGTSPTAVWKISGLTGGSYSLRFFSSRATTGSRIGKWQTQDAQNITLESTTATGVSNTGQATPGNVVSTATISGVAPVSGAITVTFTANTAGGFAYTNCFELVAGTFPSVTATSNKSSLTVPGSAILSASATPSNGGTISSYSWSSWGITYGTTNANSAPLFDAPTSATTRMDALLPVTVRPTITVTDSNGLQAWAWTGITVSPNTSTMSGVIRKLAIIGSSTSTQAYATTILPAYMTSLNASNAIVNGAASGQTTCALLPTGTSDITNCFSNQINATGNITWALNQTPNVILLQLASNDCTNSQPIANQKAAYIRIVKTARDAGVPIYVTTTQPIGDAGHTYSTAIISCQIQMRDWIKATFGQYVIDFWSGFSLADSNASAGYLQSAYVTAGDGVHMSSANVHPQLAGRLVNSGIFEQTVKPLRLTAAAMILSQ
jgi:hypothetical protein